ncbi:hypothetical protein DPX16_16609 [Anabarilius grahami]|uniref:Uncharacterized protein n=1 Tax=Anabarilius grahami TaxID=495550 RepID=A0A3N0XV78_ANAGA|nr:hypothetical protein DPX16_16609 [Anabarilius grahami]
MDTTLLRYPNRVLRALQANLHALYFQIRYLATCFQPYQAGMMNNAEFHPLLITLLRVDDALPSYCKSYLWLDKKITVRFHFGVRLEIQFKDACRQHDPRCASDVTQGHAHSPSDIHSLQTERKECVLLSERVGEGTSALCDSCLIGHSPLVARLPPPASTADEWQRITDEDTMTCSTFSQQGEQREGPDWPGLCPEPQVTGG